MTHESAFIERFARVFAGLARDRMILFRWDKLHTTAMRGLADVSVFVQRSYIPRTCCHGPHAWIEFKRGSRMPSKVQLMRALAGAARGEPNYLIQLYDSAAKLYRPVMGRDPGQPQECFHLIVAGTWVTVAQALLSLLYEDRTP